MALTVIVTRQLTIMLLLIITGFVCQKIGLITTEVNKKLSSLLLNLVNPIIILTSYQMKFQMKYLIGLLVAFALAIASFVMSILLARIVIRDHQKHDAAVERFAVIYSNCGFMGIPLINCIFGAQGVFYLTSYNTAFNLLAWTHGVMLMNAEYSPKQMAAVQKKDGINQAIPRCSRQQAITKDFCDVFTNCCKNIIRTPAVIATALGLLLFVARITLPDVIKSTLNYLGNMNTPLAMLVAGATIAQTNIMKAFTKPRIYLVSFLRLLAVPLISILMFSFFNIDRTVLLTVVTAAACPVAATGTLFAIRYNKNSFYASEIFAVTTLLSVITLPLTAMLFNAVMTLHIFH